MKFNVKFLIGLFILFSFLPAFCIKIGNQFFPIYILAVLISTLLVVTLRPKELYITTKKYYLQTPFKYLYWFFLLAIFSIFVGIIKGQFHFGGLITSMFGGLICSVMLPVILIIFLVPKYIKIKSLLKFIFLFSFFIYLFGLFEFVVYKFDISIFMDIINVFSNKRLLIYDDYDTARLIVNNLPRIRSIFEEPSYLGYYTAIFSPVIYELCTKKYRLMKCYFIDKLIKLTMVPIMWITLILTQSPIFLIFNLLFTGYYFIIRSKYYKKIFNSKIFLFLIILMIVIISIIILNIDYSNTYLNRIILVLKNMNNFSDFIVAEPSLATRIIIYINAIDIALKNFFTGIGYGNMAYIIADKLSISKVPLTEELTRFVAEGKTAPASSIFIKIFSETGIFGLFLFYKFLYELIKTIKKSKIINQSNFAYYGAYGFILFYIITSFYDSNLNQPYIFITISLILIFIKKRRQCG